MHHRRERVRKPRKQLRFEEEPCSEPRSSATHDATQHLPLPHPISGSSVNLQEVGLWHHGGLATWFQRRAASSLVEGGPWGCLAPGSSTSWRRSRSSTAIRAIPGASTTASTTARSRCSVARGARRWPRCYKTRSYVPLLTRTSCTGERCRAPEACVAEAWYAAKVNVCTLLSSIHPFRASFV